jgi:hypothetical protein
MNRFAQAVLTDDELAQLTDRFAHAAKLLKVDKIEIEHRGADTIAFPAVTKSTLVIRLGERWLGTELDWMVIEDARDGKFDRLSKACLTIAKLLHDGGGRPIGGATRFTAIAGELQLDLTEKP